MALVCGGQGPAWRQLAHGESVSSCSSRRPRTTACRASAGGGTVGQPTVESQGHIGRRVVRYLPPRIGRRHARVGEECADPRVEQPAELLRGLVRDHLPAATANSALISAGLLVMLSTIDMVSARLPATYTPGRPISSAGHLFALTTRSVRMTGRP